MVSRLPNYPELRYNYVKTTLTSHSMYYVCIHAHGQAAFRSFLDTISKAHNSKQGIANIYNSPGTDTLATNLKGSISIIHICRESRKELPYGSHRSLFTIWPMLPIYTAFTAQISAIANHARVLTGTYISRYFDTRLYYLSSTNRSRVQLKITQGDCVE